MRNPNADTILSARYTLTEHIASGGMGEVWAATDTVLDRTVAVKVLHCALTQETGFIERFRAEARHSASLHHPNITTVFDYGEDEGTAYLVMELVAGQPLSRIISERAPLSALETSSVLLQCAMALEAAHQGGVIHRDVKPANILVAADGTVKLTDFGISRLVDAMPVTQTGQVLGTVQYLSPEQAMGQRATASSDIYALGVVGHEMLTGQRPFDADTLVATAIAHIDQAPPPLPETVPAWLRTVITSAMAKDPADRPASAAVMASALGMPDTPVSSHAPEEPTALLPLTPATQVMPTPVMPTQVLPTQRRPDLRRPRLGPRSRRHPTLLATTIATALVIGAATFLALHGSTGTAGTRTPPTGPATGAQTTAAPVTTRPSSAATTSVTTATPPRPTSSVPPQPPPGKGNGKKKGKQ